MRQPLGVAANSPLPLIDQPGKIARVNVLGIGLSAVNMQMVLDQFVAWIAQDRREYVCIRDIHGVVRSVEDLRLRDIHNKAGLVTPDGMPLVWIGRRQGFAHVDRVYGPDLLAAACARIPGRHFFYGGKPGVAEQLAAKLSERFPQIDIAGWHSPPMRPAGAFEDAEVLARINAAAPDIIWVGLSTPKQEYWMSTHRPLLKAPLLVGIGAAFDFHAGLVPQAPRIVQRSGMEWLFRLACEPRRLGPRYFEIIPKFLLWYAAQRLGLRRFAEPGTADRMAAGSDQTNPGQHGRNRHNPNQHGPNDHNPDNRAPDGRVPGQQHAAGTRLEEKSAAARDRARGTP